ncbi:MAG TPA: BamA/TamA family outer membrane protein [Thermoanaerobaculia bacterium]|nr:BamA/TamA family outer membrane protein [Thermoanaerobaculia bacterium]
MPSRRLRLVPAAAVLAALLPALPAPASAQYFGRNKVQWEKFDWQVLSTEHFDVHFYPPAAREAADAARMAERWYDRLTSVFGFDLRERKPIILYANHSDFQQTTVVGSLIGEGTGGLTEPLRSRVVMPLTGSYADTDHVLGHELVHVFQFEILLGGREQGRSGGAQVPLWFIEGLAEYLSLGREASHTAMWLRDALAREDLPDLRKMSRQSRFFPYRWGHAFWAYVGGRWGDRVVGNLFTAGAALGVEAALEEVLGLRGEDFSAAWSEAIRRDYSPIVTRRTAPRAAGQRLLPQGDRVRDSYVSPVVSPDGSQVIFLSTRSLFTFDLYLADARTGQIRDKLLSADADPHFDALRFLDSAGTWSPDGRKFAFVVFARGDNQIAVLDVGSRRIERRIQPEGIGAIWNPAWSPDGKTLAFSGAKGAMTDLYLLDLESGGLRQLTDDRHADLQPAWSPDGKTLAFTSDRGRGTDFATLHYAPLAVWLLDVASREVRPAAAGADAGWGRAHQVNPAFAPNGRELYFLSDREGVNDLFRLELGGGLSQVTRLATGVSGITTLSPALSVAQRSGRVLFSVFDDTSYAIHALEPEQARGEPAGPVRDEVPVAALLPPVQAEARSTVQAYLDDEADTPRQAERETQLADYNPDMKLDYLAPVAGVAVSSFGNVVGGDITAQFGDMLGQHTVGVTLFGTGGALDEFGAQAYYLNREQRWNWGVAGGHVPLVSARTQVRPTTVVVDGQTVQGREIQQLRETVTLDRVSLVTHYPFSIRRRFEAAVGYTRMDFDLELLSATVVGDTIVDRSEESLPGEEPLDLMQGSFALVGDNSYYGFTSPVRGERYRLEIEPTFGTLQFQSFLADYRRYLFRRPVTLAFRALHYGRYGQDAESERLSPLYIGHDTLVRGYRLGSIDADECTVVPGDPRACPEFDRLIGSRLAVANVELRLPLFGTRDYGLVELPWLPTELSAFVDAGVAWTADESPELEFVERSVERIPVVSAGLSARVLLGGFAVLEFYYAVPFQRPAEEHVTGFVISPGW